MAILTKDTRAQAIQQLQAYFQSERDEKLGDLAAGAILDFIEREMGPAFYNQALKDAAARAVQAFAGLEEELEALRLVPKRGK
jgi:uncharacterized protein (DUF2164 family)